MPVVLAIEAEGQLQGELAVRARERLVGLLQLGRFAGGAVDIGLVLVFVLLQLGCEVSFTLLRILELLPPLPA